MIPTFPSPVVSSVIEKVGKDKRCSFETTREQQKTTTEILR